MAHYEWTGTAYEVRGAQPPEAISWLSRADLAKEFRQSWLYACSRESSSDMQTEEAPPEETLSLLRQIRVGINEAFCDGVNSGFYVNSYTTKPGPALAGMLEELRKGAVFFGIY